jgi:hypothetical protein
MSFKNCVEVFKMFIKVRAEYYYIIQVNQYGLPLHPSKDELHAALEG